MNPEPEETNRRLKRAIEVVRVEGYKLNSTDISNICHCSKHTARAWLASTGSKRHRQMPEAMLRLLLLELGMDKPISSTMEITILTE